MLVEFKKISYFEQLSQELVIQFFKYIDIVEQI